MNRDPWLLVDEDVSFDEGEQLLLFPMQQKSKE
jgi:hypothetical protein